MIREVPEESFLVEQNHILPFILTESQKNRLQKKARTCNLDKSRNDKECL